jgi:hypothetical protein
MIGTKLNAQVIIKNLPEHAREVTRDRAVHVHSGGRPAHGSARENAAGISGLGPPARQGTTHGRTQRPPSGVADVEKLRDGQ